MIIRNELINEICAERNIKVEYLSKDYILQLTKDNQSRHIFGPYWGLNSATADRLACDKAGCYIMLNQGGVPAIEHVLMYNPLRRSYLMDDQGVMTHALEFFHKNNRQVVAKPNLGAQGRDVYFCDTPLALEQAIMTIFATEPDVALCPYHEINTEYRVFYLHGRAHYIYGKTKGDTWKHNLSQGAVAFEVTDESLLARLEDLAVRAARCINISFATIDIAVLEDGELAVLEINAGVQVQHLLEQLPERRGVVKDMYAEAVDGMFG